MQSKTMARKPTGRVTPKKGAPAGAGRPGAGRPDRPEKWQLDDSRQVRTGWAWRGLLAMSLVAVGVAIIMAGNHHDTFALIWLVIGAGWFGFSMLLWRKHSRYMRGD